MKNLLAFLARHNHWFLFLLLEICSSSIIFKYNNYQGSVWFNSASYVVGKIYDVRSQVEQYFSLKANNELLTKENIYLNQQIHAYEQTHKKTENDSLLLTQLSEQVKSKLRLYPAKVIRNTIHLSNNLITIDKGANDGIRKDMAVVCGTGVVGIVFVTSAHYSVVIPILSSHSSISCAIKRNGFFGHLGWKKGDITKAYLDDIPRHAKIKRNDQVITSGYSSIFPPGLPIGKVIKAYNAPDGLSYRLIVKLSTDFANLNDVCVIDNSYLQEERYLIQEASERLDPPKK